MGFKSIALLAFYLLILLGCGERKLIYQPDEKITTPDLRKPDAEDRISYLDADVSDDFNYFQLLLYYPKDQLRSYLNLKTLQTNESTQEAICLTKKNDLCVKFYINFRDKKEVQVKVKKVIFKFKNLSSGFEKSVQGFSFRVLNYPLQFITSKAEGLLLSSSYSKGEDYFFNFGIPIKESGDRLKIVSCDSAAIDNSKYQFHCGVKNPFNNDPMEFEDWNLDIYDDF